MEICPVGVGGAPVNADRRTGEITKPIKVVLTTIQTHLKTAY